MPELDINAPNMRGAAFMGIECPTTCITDPLTPDDQEVQSGIMVAPLNISGMEFVGIMTINNVNGQIVSILTTLDKEDTLRIANLLIDAAEQTGDYAPEKMVEMLAETTAHFNDEQKARLREIAVNGRADG